MFGGYRGSEVGSCSIQKRRVSVKWRKGSSDASRVGKSSSGSARERVGLGGGVSADFVGRRVQRVRTRRGHPRRRPARAPDDDDGVMIVELSSYGRPCYSPGGRCKAGQGCRPLDALPLGDSLVFDLDRTGERTVPLHVEGGPRVPRRTRDMPGMCEISAASASASMGVSVPRRYLAKPSRVPRCQASQLRRANCCSSMAGGRVDR